MEFIPVLCLAVAAYTAVAVGVGLGRSVRRLATGSKPKKVNTQKDADTTIQFMKPVDLPYINMKPLDRSYMNLTPIKPLDMHLLPQAWQTLPGGNYPLGHNTYGPAMHTRRVSSPETVSLNWPVQPKPADPFAGTGRVTGWRYEGGRRRRL